MPKLPYQNLPAQFYLNREEVQNTYIESDESNSLEIDLAHVSSVGKEAVEDMLSILDKVESKKDRLDKGYGSSRRPSTGSRPLEGRWDLSIDAVVGTLMARLFLPGSVVAKIKFKDGQSKKEGFPLIYKAGSLEIHKDYDSGVYGLTTKRQLEVLSQYPHIEYDLVD